MEVRYVLPYIRTELTIHEVACFVRTIRTMLLNGISEARVLLARVADRDICMSFPHEVVALSCPSSTETEIPE